MALQADDIADLVKSVLKDQDRFNWTDLTSDIQEYIALPQILTEERVGFGGGTGFKFRFMNGTSGAARNVGLYSTDNTSVADVFVEGSVPWRHSETSYAWDLHEFDMNMGEEEIFDLITARRFDSMVDLAKLLENDFWSKPSSSSDTTTPFGLGYWIVYNATTGFNGGNPSGFTAGAGGIDSDTYTRWKNFTANYSAVTKSDLIKTLRLAVYKTNFKAPMPSPGNTPEIRRALYTNYDVVAEMESLLEAQNENLGNDLASKDGMVMLRGVPVITVPQLDDTAHDAVFGIDWSQFKPVFLRGWYIKESGAKPSATQHNVVDAHVDLSYNYVAKDRRRLFVVAKSDPFA